MSEEELEVVKETGTLRGGREGETYFTDSYYKNANNAQSKLALKDKPTYNVEFKITNNPKIRGGNTVTPSYDQIGGGREYFSRDKIEVEIINFQKNDRRTVQMMKKIIISEPWNFHSSDGDNIMIIKVERTYKDNIVAIVLSDYTDKNSDYIYIRKRDKYGNLNIFDYDIVNNKIGHFIAIGYYD